MAVCLAVALATAACGSSSNTQRLSVKSNGKAATTTTSAVLPITIFSAWGSTWSYNPYNSFFPGTVIDGFVDLPLAVQILPTLTKYSPQLATSWSASGDTLTVQLRHSATWQNGTPVTSTDVYDTILLNGTDGGDPQDLSEGAVETATAAVDHGDRLLEPGVCLGELADVQVAELVHGGQHGPGEVRDAGILVDPVGNRDGVGADWCRCGVRRQRGHPPAGPDRDRTQDREHRHLPGKPDVGTGRRRRRRGDGPAGQPAQRHPL